MHLKLVTANDDAICCKIENDITQAVIDPTEEPLQHMFGRDVYNRTLLLDLEAANFIDSSGIGWLLSIHKRFRQAGGQLIMHSPSPMVMQTIKLLNMDKVFKMVSDLDSARAVAQGEQA